MADPSGVTLRTSEDVCVYPEGKSYLARVYVWVFESETG